MKHKQNYLPASFLTRAKDVMKDHANEALPFFTGKQLRKQIHLIQQRTYTRCSPLIPSYTFPYQMVGNALTLLLQS